MGGAGEEWGRVIILYDTLRYYTIPHYIALYHTAMIYHTTRYYYYIIQYDAILENLLRERQRSSMIPIWRHVKTGAYEQGCALPSSPRGPPKSAQNGPRTNYSRPSGRPKPAPNILCPRSCTWDTACLRKWPWFCRFATYRRLCLPNKAQTQNPSNKHRTPREYSEKQK